MLVHCHKCYWESDKTAILYYRILFFCVEIFICMYLWPASDILQVRPRPGGLQGLFWVRWFVSTREALMPQCHVYFSLSALAMAALYPDAGISWMCVRVCLCLRSKPFPMPSHCQDSHSKQAHHFDEFIRWECHGVLSSCISNAHCQHHVHIYIVVWHRYTSKTVAADLSLSVIYSHNFINNKTIISSARGSRRSLRAGDISCINVI